MAEVRSLLETEIAGLLAGVVDCPVLPGRARDNSDRPDHYVVIVAEEGEHRGGMVVLADVEIKTVVPIDDPHAVAKCNVRQKQITDWLCDTDCPLWGYRANGLKVHGFNFEGVATDEGSRSYAEIVKIRCGAMAL